MNKRVFCVLICLLVVLTALCGCVNDQESAQMEQQCRTVLDALISGDADAGWAVIDPQYCTREEFDAVFASAASDFAGVRSYELRQNGIETSITNGIRRIALSYMVIDGEEVICYVSVEKIGDGTSLSGFSVDWVEGGVSTKTLNTIVLVVIALLGAFGLFAVAAVVIVIVVLLRKRKKEQEKRADGQWNTMEHKGD